MDGAGDSARRQYDALVEALLSDDRGTFEAPGKGVGSSALKTGGQIFAMLVGDRLVVKLPRQRVDALIDARAGHRFDPGQARPSHSAWNRRRNRSMNAWRSHAMRRPVSVFMRSASRSSFSAKWLMVDPRCAL